jgi:hypothetical protein
MRLILFIALAACGTDVVELVPDAAAEDSGVLQDTGSEDSGVPEDTGTVDTGAPDLGPPDSGSTCVCRFVSCRDDPGCEAAIGAGSTCVRNVCTGATGSCAIDSECGGGGWSCTIDPTSLDPCP